MNSSSEDSGIELATESVLEAVGIRVRVETIEVLETEGTIAEALRLDGAILNESVEVEEIGDLSFEEGR